MVQYLCLICWTSLSWWVDIENRHLFLGTNRSFVWFLLLQFHFTNISNWLSPLVTLRDNNTILPLNLEDNEMKRKSWQVSILPEQWKVHCLYKVKDIQKKEGKTYSIIMSILYICRYLLIEQNHFSILFFYFWTVHLYYISL